MNVRPISNKPRLAVVALIVASVAALPARASYEAKLARAEQLAATGSLRAAIETLTPLAEGRGVASRARSRAAQELASLWLASGAPDRALRYGELALAEGRGVLGDGVASIGSSRAVEDRVDLLLLLTEAHRRLGETAKAGEHLKAASVAFASIDPEPTPARTVLRSRLQRLAESLSVALNGEAAAEPRLGRLDERGDPVAAQRWVEGLLAAERHADAIAWLDRLGLDAAEPTRGLTPRELAELHVMRAQAVAALASRGPDEEDPAEENPAGAPAAGASLAGFKAAERSLATWRSDFRGRLQRGEIARVAALEELAELESAAADLAENLADVLRRQTPPDRDGAERAWLEASATLDRLVRVTGQLRDAAVALADSDPVAARREAIVEVADQRLDRALVGLQRVLLRLDERGGPAVDAVPSSAGDAAGLRLRAAARGLARLRARRLTPTDPRLLDARVANAFVLASTGDHDRAIDEFAGVLAAHAKRVERDTAAEAQATLGLGMSLLAKQRFAEAGKRLAEARELAESVEVGGDAGKLIAGQAGAALGYLTLIEGEYRLAADWLREAERAQPRDGHSQADAVVSTAKVFLALLERAEGRVSDAVATVGEARRLGETSPFVGRRHLAAYDVVDAALALDGAAKAPRGSRRRLEQIERAKGYLRGLRSQAVAGLSDEVQRAIDVLEAQLLALEGDVEGALRGMQRLADDGRNDPATRARALLGLSRLERFVRVEAGEPRANALRSSLDHAGRAIAVLDTLREAGAGAVYPGLEFQARTEWAWLIDGLVRSGDSAVIADQGPQSMSPSPSPSPLSSPEGVVRATFDRPLAADPMARAIEQLERAIRVAERPAGSTTLEGLGRSRFFTRYAPAYDLLVSLLIRSAEQASGNTRGGVIDARAGSLAHQRLVRAMEVSDLARNRTFREAVGQASNDARVDPWLMPVGAGPSETAALPRLVEPGTALLVYHLGGVRWASFGGSGPVGADGGGWAFVVSDGGQRVTCHPLTVADVERTPFSRAEANRLVTPYVELLAEAPRGNGGSREPIMTGYRDELLALTDAVLPQGVRDRVAEAAGVGLLRIVPDGRLHQLPFETLLRKAGRQSEFAIDWLPPTIYAPSLSVIADLAKRERAAGGRDRVVSIGDPAYPAIATGVSAVASSMTRSAEQLAAELEVPTRAVEMTLTPLANAAEEVRRVSQAFAARSAVQSLLGPEATEAAFRRLAPSATVLHVAAHAYAERDAERMFAALALTPGPGDDAADDGWLRLEELTELSFKRCELAILSACETLVGADRPLEIPMSLTRGLLERNARRVVSSQWVLNDQAAAELTPRFCQLLVDQPLVDAAAPEADAARYAAALREAKRAWRRENGDAGDDPHYWAPLVLVGTP